MTKSIGGIWFIYFMEVIHISRESIMGASTVASQYMYNVITFYTAISIEILWLNNM